MDIPCMYREKLNTNVFLDDYFTFESMEGRTKHQLAFFHESFKKIPNGVEVLDYGAGPSILTTISAATKASRIIVAELTEDNRKAISQWLNEDKDAFDWDKHFSYVIKDLERKEDDAEIAARKDRVRRCIEAVVECDVTVDPFISSDYNKQYDVVITSLVAEAAASTLEELKIYLKRITSFIKPNGTLLYYGVECRLGYYVIDNEQFPNVTATAEFVMSALTEIGFANLTLGEYEPSDDPYRVFRWIHGTNSK